jgi:hypothetical protein
MTQFDVTDKPRLKHHGRRIVVRERHQRPRVSDLGTKWKFFYWDYSFRQPSRSYKELG